MTDPRTKYIDPDYRRDPKTDHFCCRCQKDIKPGSPFRMVHCVDGGMSALHPDDEANYVTDAGDMGCFPIGMDCARKIGLEWSHPAKPAA